MSNGSKNRIKTGKNSFLRLAILAVLGGFAITFKFTEAIPFWAYGSVTQDFLIARIYSLLGDYQFDMIVASLMCGCTIFIIEEKLGEFIRGCFLPCMLAVIVVLGRSAAAYGNLSGVFGAVPLFIRAVIAIAGFTVIFRYVFAVFEAGMDRIGKVNAVPKAFASLFGDHIFRNSFILLFVLWLPVAILNYPGNHNSDFIGQLLQNKGEMPYSTHHPIVLTWFIGLFFGMFKAVTGNFDIALFVWILLQMAALSAALSLTLSELKKRNASYGVLMTVLLIYVLTPIYSNIVTTAIKDVFFASACIWYCMLTLSFYEDEKGFMGSKKNLVYFCIASCLVCMCRNNGTLIVFVNGLVMSVYGMKDASPEDKSRHAGTVKKAIFLLILPLVIHTAFSSGIKAAKGAESDGLKEMMSIPIQQTSLYLIRYEDELTEEEKESISALFGDYKNMIDNYDPTISDTVKQFYDTSASDDVVRDYIMTWVSLFFKHPGTYFESFFLSGYGWFDPETDTSVRYEGDSELFSRTGLFEGADEILIFFYRYIDRISFFGLLQSPGLWTFIMLILIRKNRGSKHLYAMQLITLLVCMAGPCFMKHARYAFPIMFTIPFMMGYEITSDAGRKPEETAGK